MRVLGLLAAMVVGVSVCFSFSSGTVMAEQITVQNKLTITTRVASRLCLIVDEYNQIKEIFSNSDEKPEVVLAMLDNLGGPTVLIDKNIQSQYESLKPFLSYSYGTIYKQGQKLKPASEASYNTLPEKSFVSLLQNIGIRI
jgi:hypothetical protein